MVDLPDAGMRVAALSKMLRELELDGAAAHAEWPHFDVLDALNEAEAALARVAEVLSENTSIVDELRGELAAARMRLQLVESERGQDLRHSGSVWE